MLEKIIVPHQDIPHLTHEFYLIDDNITKRQYPLSACVYDSGVAGKTVVIFAAVHGNEICGIEAIGQLMSKIDSNEITLDSGKLILVPIANPAAYEQNTRYLHSDLNRSFWPVEQPTTYEDQLHYILCGYLDQADGFLDLHSYHWWGDPVVFATGPEHENEYYRSLGVSNLMSGWKAAHGGEGNWKTPSTTAVFYARHNNRQCLSVTLECGYHQDSEAVNVAYEGILRTLSFMGLLQKDNIHYHQHEKLPEYQEFSMVSNGVVRKTENLANAQIAQNWNNLDFIKAGTMLLVDDHNTPLLYAENDFHILFPNPNAAIGDELFSYSVKKSTHVSLQPNLAKKLKI